MITETQIEPECVFYMEVPIRGRKVIYLVFHDGKEKAVYPIDQRSVMIAAEKVRMYTEKAGVICRTMAQLN